MIDSGAALNLINKDIVKKYNIPTQPCIPPIEIKAINDTLIDHGIHYQTKTVKLQLLFGDLLAVMSEGQPDEPMEGIQTDLDHMKHQNSTTDQTNKSDSQAGKNLQASSAEGQDSLSSLDKQTPKDIKTIKGNKSDTQPEKDICKNGNVNTTQSQLPAPQDIATFKIKVDWTEPFSEKWEKDLEKALQSWFNQQMNGTKPGTSAALDDTNNGVNAATSNKDPNETKNSETSAELTVPPYHYWYMVHAYRKDMEKIEKQYGVSINAEVSVSLKPTHSSSSDSVSKAFDDFQKLVWKCVQSFSEATINHSDMDSDTVKHTLRAIQSEESKMMFTMSASNCLLFGPKNITDMIKRETTGVEQQSKGKSNEMDVDKDFSPQNRPSLDIDTNDLPNQLEMKKMYWDLMKLSYKEQISQLETKYNVSFYERSLQNNWTIKVQAQSTGEQHINLESHALRALTHLYQKLASAAISCELKNQTDKTAVAQIVEELQQQHYGVVAVDVFSPWRLFGLPEHLGPAIAHTEKKLQKDVFDYKVKKLIGYSGDIPHARGIKRNQMPDYGPGAVGGAAWDKGVNFRGRGEAETGVNEESKDSSRHDSKGAHAEEETCVICMDSFNDKEKLKCGHEFCRDCIKRSVNNLGSICPVCKEVFGKLEGNQPDGKMTVTTSKSSLPGYPDCGTIEITYNIPSGIQTDIYTADDEIQAPAPLDIAKFKIKVDWTEPFSERWQARLQKALQSWLSRLEGKPSVLSLELMEDPSCAEVQITPSIVRDSTIIITETQDSRQHLDHINTDITTDQTNKSDSQEEKDWDHMKHQNITMDQTNKSDSQAEKNLQASSAKGQGSKSFLDKQMPRNIKMVQRIKSDSQTEKMTN
ncbi:E3 ubiquitin- ligase DTX3L-like protein [Labeo rohita]|uniref:E3 ubiquitin-protein ligase n=1 Tax=Labeo rohita TaxID=84645 RepID=A0A498NK19_LABRO|nr:E3 ubiquitin- ligase DTX3L-like protein [Labeo rohita]